MAQQEIQFILDNLDTIQDFPKKGIDFKDISPLMKDPAVFNKIIDLFADKIKHLDFDYIVGLESRGFLFGTALSIKINKGFVMLRKKNKLPGEVYKYTYDLEYGSDTVELQKSAFKDKQKCIIIDDLLATGGTAQAACELVKQAGGDLKALCFLYEIKALNGCIRLPQNVEKISLVIE